MAVGARRRLQALSDRMSLVSDGAEILPGVVAHATFGHTPGHMSFELRDGGESLLVGGDAIGNHHVSLAEPGWRIGTDQEPETAAKTRKRLLDMLAQDNIRLIGYHFPNGGVGRVERLGDGFIFVSEV